jgi:hypothetical protein
MAYTYSKIATYTVGSGGVASIDFLNIPQTYTDLVIKVSSRDTSAFNYRDLRIGFNGVTTNLSGRILYGEAGVVGSYSVATGLVAWDNSANSTANTFSNVEYYIPNYAGSNNKSFSVDSVTENNATAVITNISAGLWSSLSAITQINLSPLTGTFVQYTTAHLYGIKAEL